MKHSSSNETILALDAEKSPLGTATSAIDRRSFDATILALDAETSAIKRSYLRYRRGVIGDCGVGVTPQMCNRVTNHGDIGTFSRPDIHFDIFACRNGPSVTVWRIFEFVHCPFKWNFLCLQYLFTINILEEI